MDLLSTFLAKGCETGILSHDKQQRLTDAPTEPELQPGDVPSSCQVANHEKSNEMKHSDDLQCPREETNGIQYSCEMSNEEKHSQVDTYKLTSLGCLSVEVPTTHGVLSDTETCTYLKGNPSSMYNLSQCESKMCGCSDVISGISSNVQNLNAPSLKSPLMSSSPINTNCDTLGTKMSTSDIGNEKYDIEPSSSNNLEISESLQESVAMDLRMFKVVDTCHESGLDSLGNSPQSDNNGSPIASGLQDYNSQSYKSQPRVLQFPPCDICTGKASGLHYGCNTCEACKNFFRRYLIRNKRYKCAKDNSCVISSARKGNCSECRLTKCLTLGMAKGKSKMGRYSYSRRTETINKVKQLEGKDLSVKEQLDELLQPLSHPLVSHHHKPEQQVFVAYECFTEMEIDLIDNLIVALEKIKPWGDSLDSKEARDKCLKEHHNKYMLKIKLFGTLSNVSKDEYQILLRNYGIDLDESYDVLKNCGVHWDRIVGHYCNYAKNIPGFKGLSYSDQEILLKANHFDFFCLLMHEGYDEELQVFLEINGMPYHIEESADKFFSREFIVSIFALYSRLQKLNISIEELVLLTSMVTLSSDNCEIENTELVQAKQEFVSNILIKFLKYKFGEAAGMRKFTKYVDCLLEIRRLGLIYSKEYSGLCQDELFQDVYKEDLIPRNALYTG